MNVFSFIKSNVAILDVVQSYTTLKKAGLYWKGHCPFHSEKTASFTVSPHKEIFYCFGCHAHGDVISFISKVENCSTLDAVHFLSDRFALTLPEDVPYKQDPSVKLRYYHICELLAGWFHDQFLQSSQAQAYMRNRALTQATIKSYLIGYLPGGKKGIKVFLNAMKEHYILESDLIDAYILIKGSGGLYSPFEDRILFPIKDHLGRFCGFGGRIFKEHDARVKYYNSREGDYFNKGKLLFNLDMAKKDIQKKSKVFLVEGYMDCLAMVQKGYRNTVATLGTACTLHVLHQLSRYAQNVLIVYDADSAGTNALLRIAQLCWEVALELEVIILPDGEDPASFVTGNDLQPLIDRAQDIFSFFVATVSKEFDKKSLSEKLKTAQKIITLIHTVSDPLKRSLLLQKASLSLGLPIESIQGAFKVKEKQTIPSVAQTVSSEVMQENSIKKLSKKIFFVIVQNMILLKNAHIEQVCLLLADPFKSLMYRLHTLQDIQREPILFTQYFDTLNEQEQQIVSETVLEFDEDPHQTFDELIEQLQKKQWKLTVQTVKKNIERAKEQQDHERVTILLQELMTLKKKMMGNALVDRKGTISQ